MKRPKLLREWVGLRCALLHDVQTNAARAVRGTHVTVVSAGPGGLDCASDQCLGCQVRFFVRKLHPSSLDPIERVAPENPARRRR